MKLLKSFFWIVFTEKKPLVWILSVHCTENEVFRYGFLESMWPNPLPPVDFVAFTKEILDWKLHFLCSGIYWSSRWKLPLNSCLGHFKNYAKNVYWQPCQTSMMKPFWKMFNDFKMLTISAVQLHLRCLVRS